MFGFYNIHKPQWVTSHDVVAHVRRALRTHLRETGLIVPLPSGKWPKVKVGHAGTLDPFAEGVLIVCVGSATKLADYIQRQRKRYTATITLGATSTTEDPEGDITVCEAATLPDEATIREILPTFVGEIQQVPPAHSAVHVDGQRAYDLARRGEILDLPTRAVTIYDITCLEYDGPTLTLDVTCGSGTYIRSLARDIGQAAGCGGYCSALTRTAIGPFVEAEAAQPAELDLDGDLLSPKLGLEMPLVTLDESQRADMVMGKSIDWPGPVEAEEVAAVDQAGDLLALAIPRDGRLQPRKVFVQ